MKNCRICKKEKRDKEVLIFDMCDDCYFTANFKNPEEVRVLLADALEQEGEMCLESDNTQLKKIGEKLKHYALIVERL